MLVGGEDGVHSEKSTGWQHSRDAEWHAVGHLDQVLEVVHHEVLHVSIGNALVRVHNNSITESECRVLGELRAEGLYDTGDLVSREQSGIAHTVMGQGGRVVTLDGDIGGEAAAAGYGVEAGEAWRALRLVASAGTDDADASAPGGNLRHGYVEAEDALPAADRGALDRQLPAELVHLHLAAAAAAAACAVGAATAAGTKHARSVGLSISYCALSRMHGCIER